jgi:hypothetical protein
MASRTINASTVNQSSFRTTTAVGGSGPTLLAEDELELVAAAGGRPTGSGGGDVRCRH